MTGNRASRSRKRPRRGRRRRSKAASRRLALLLRAAVILAVLGTAILLFLWVEVGRLFDRRLWTDPSVVYSAALDLDVGSSADPEAIAARLERSGYARADVVRGPGTYRRDADVLEVHLRPFDAPGRALPARRRTLRFRDGRLARAETPEGERADRVVLEPEVLLTLFGPRQEERRPIPFDRLPRGFVDAVLAAEDARYFDHGGIDLRAIARAALANVRSGRVVQGGSTIPQQTVKNLYLGQQRTWWRKIREIPMAVILDARYPKERILEVYLNEVYLGQRGPVAVCGAESAARHYFGRSIADLGVGEWAMLAGMIRSPGRYNPFVHPERAIARRDQVLDAMVRLGRLDEAAADRARSEPWTLASGSAGYPRARYLSDAVRAELARLYPEVALEHEGLQVYTTLDTRLQEAAESAVRDGLARLERDRPGLVRPAGEPRLQGVAVVTDPVDGAVLALVGGRDYSETQFNRALDARRQPGSCFKPFVVLAAFEDRDAPGGVVTPATRIADEPIDIETPTGTWSPRNYDGRYRGEVGVREALRDSLNVPTVRLARHVGIEAVVETARACGIESELEPYPSLALGAQEVTPLELAGAYGTLAAGGVRTRPRLIEEIRDREGVRIERREARPRRVADERSVFLVNRILQDVLDRGTARSSRALGWDGWTAGKTGTTDDTRDAWFVGYGPRLLALVWVGFDDNRKTGLTGATGALPIWVDLVRRAPPERSRAEFERVPGVVQVRIDPTTGGRATAACPETLGEWFVEGLEPVEECRDHRARGRRWFRDWFRRDRDPP